MPVSYRKLGKYPRSLLIDEDLVRGRVSELDLLGRLGAPTLESPASEPEPTFFWDVEWGCGLVMDLRFNQLTEEVAVRLDEPEVVHALRHLGFTLHDPWTLEQDDPVNFRRMRLTTVATFELWGEDDGGRKTLLEGGLTERDAQCRALDLGEADPGRKYWVQSGLE